MTPLQAMIAALLGAGLVIAGIVMLAGLAWAFIASGGLVCAGTVLLYDPSKSP